VRIRRAAGFLVATVTAVAVIRASHQVGTSASPGHAGQVAVAYAERQIGLPYLWGGTGPDAFDCSGLVMMAYRQSGITFNSARPDANMEYEYGKQVSTPEVGDLVFFAGADGTPQAPGHVGIVVDPRRHLMIDAYASGLPVEWDTYGLPTSKEGLTDPVGYTDPVSAG
jgi:peptidoglycan DL-endopeptidase CwlO